MDAMMGWMVALLLLAAEGVGAMGAWESAQRGYDTGAMEALAGELRTKCAGTEATEGERAALAAALLSLAEWSRIDYEECAKEARAQRQALGERIDALSREGLELMRGMREDSEWWRMRADFHGVMMRTTAQARKYKAVVEEAIARATELDPANPNAWATAAKPHLFAEPGQGQDLPRAIVLLNKALELSPKLESARLLRALAYERMGETATARREWEAVLAENPACTPAKRQLEKPVE